MSWSEEACRDPRWGWGLRTSGGTGVIDNVIGVLAPADATKGRFGARPFTPLAFEVLGAADLERRSPSQNSVHSNFQLES